LAGRSLLKTYFRYLTHEDRVRCQIESEKGLVIKFVIQYEIFIQDVWSAVTRFDTFHDTVHRDLFAPDGTITKRWFLNFNFDEGLTFAYNDIENNWEKYREWYISRMER
jgi:hypothetical protein